jgi:hypothetical protein
MIGCNRKIQKTEVKSIAKKEYNYGGKPSFDFSGLPTYDVCDFIECSQPQAVATNYIYGMQAGKIVGYKKVNSSYTQVANETVSNLLKVVVTDNNIFALIGTNPKAVSIYEINNDGSITNVKTGAGACDTCGVETFSVAPNATQYSFSNGSLYRFTVAGDYSISSSLTSIPTASSDYTVTSNNTTWVYSSGASKIYRITHGQSGYVQIGASSVAHISVHYKGTNECMIMTRGTYWEELCISGGFEDYGQSTIVGFDSGFIIGDNNFVTDDGNLISMSGADVVNDSVFVCTGAKIESLFDGKLVIDCGTNIVIYDADLNEVENTGLDITNPVIKNF